MRKSAFRGFTLVEMLVVIAVMALIGTFTLANFRTFGEDQSLKQGVLDIQSQLRSAQTNATANYKCNTGYGATWQVEFASSTVVNLKCQEPSASSFLKKAKTLDANLVIDSILGVGSSCPPAPPFVPPLPTVNFSPLTGEISLGGANCTKLTITLKNIRSQATKSLTIEKGGKINE